MKKILIAFLMLLLLSTICVYVFIPKEIFVSRTVSIKASENWVLKCLSDKNYLDKWWPKQTHSQEFEKNNYAKKYNYNKQTFLFDKVYIKGVQINIIHYNLIESSQLNIHSIKADSTVVQWEVRLEANLNPVRRIQKYLMARSITPDMDHILAQLKLFLEKEENIYGIKVLHGHIKDTLLISTKAFSVNYPEVSQVYRLINELQNHVIQNSAKETGFPMLNITKLQSDGYSIQVALPINREIPQTSNFKIKHMFPGNTLITEITGGPITIRDAFNALEQYLDDYSMSSPAIPFESIITNRMIEKDTSKWVTKVYYPVF